MKLHASGEDYLETILVLQKEKGMVRSVDVARRMGVSKLGGCPPIIKQNEYDIHTVVLQGAAVFFYSTDFSFFSDTFLLSNKSRQICISFLLCLKTTLTLMKLFRFLFVITTIHPLAETVNILCMPCSGL